MILPYRIVVRKIEKYQNITIIIAVGKIHDECCSGRNFEKQDIYSLKIPSSKYLSIVMDENFTLLTNSLIFMDSSPG